GPYGIVCGTPADPDDMRAVLLHHKVAPGLTDAAGTTDDHVDTPGTVQVRVIYRPRVHGQKLLTEPFTTTIGPDIAERIRGQGATASRSRSRIGQGAYSLAMLPTSPWMLAWVARTVSWLCTASMSVVIKVQPSSRAA